ncbi:MAG: PilZ domain-containing protein [Deltaproteobacteria bacterium]|nr:PilZ domain-containing protein [Deltaproteobacteria bacterium]
MATKRVEVLFPSGKDVLNSYWGYLSTGGLVIRDEVGLEVGDFVEIDARIESTQQRHLLRGHVVHRRGARGAIARVVIAFSPGEPQDLLLSSAWADADNVPARRHRRFPSSTPVTLGYPVEGQMERHDALLLNISRGGACLRVPQELARPLAVGGPILLVDPRGTVSAEIRWRRGNEVAIEFQLGSERDSDLVQKLLDQVVLP